jgi:hypothetical protein
MKVARTNICGKACGSLSGENDRLAEEEKQCLSKRAKGDEGEKIFVQIYWERRFYFNFWR